MNPNDQLYFYTTFDLKTFPLKLRIRKAPVRGGNERNSAVDKLQRHSTIAITNIGTLCGKDRDMTADAKAPALLPTTASGELLVRYTGGPQRFGFPEGLEREIRNFAGHQWVILGTPRNRQVIREAKQWVIARDQLDHLRRKSPGLMPATTYTYTVEQIFTRAKE